MKFVSGFILLVIFLSCTKQSVPVEAATVPGDSTVQSAAFKMNWCNGKDIYLIGDGLVEAPGSVSVSLQLDTILHRKVVNLGKVGYTSTKVRQLFVTTPVLKNGNVIIWAGRDNYRSPSVVLDDLREMVAYLGHARYMIMEIPNGDYLNEYRNEADWTKLKYINDEIEKAFPKHFIRFKSVLVNKHTPAETRDATNDVSPRHLRTDEIYFTSEANGIIARQIVLALDTCAPPVVVNVPDSIAPGIERIDFDAKLPVDVWGDSHSSGMRWMVNGVLTYFTDPYPAQLGRMLGIEIQNFGAASFTSTQVRVKNFESYPKRFKNNEIIWVGANGGFANAATIATTLADIDMMIAKMGHSRYIIMGLTGRALKGYWAGEYYHKQLRIINDQMAAKYGNHFYNPAPDLKAAAIKDPSDPWFARDKLTTERDLIPAHLQYDDTHINSLGNTIIAKGLFARIKMIP